MQPSRRTTGTNDFRRNFLRSAAALAAAGAAAPLLSGCAATRAAGPGATGAGTGASASATPGAIARVAPGVVRIPLAGGFTVTAISDGEATMPLAEGFVRDVPLTQVQAALRDAGLPTDTITISFTTFLLEAGGRRVLLDTGNGQFGAPTSGRLLANLAAAGVTPASIDTVAITHFHGDHINGLRDREGRLAFPNARILVPQPEWDFWMDDARMAAAPEAARGGFQAVRRVFGPIAQGVQRFSPGQEILPGVRSMAAYGHTPGHTAYMIGTGPQKLVYWGDLTNIAALFVRNPDWAVRFDMDAAAARDTRRRMMEAAIAENWLVAGYHLPFPAAGRIERRGGGYEFVPASAA